MKFKNAKYLFFDLDHTLWDFDLNSKLAYRQIFEEQGVTLDLDQFIAIYEPLNLEYWRMYRNNEIGKEHLRFHRLKSAFDACNYTVTREQIDLFADLYISYLPNYNHLFEGCIDLLDHLSQNYELHCITNGFIEVQQQKMERSGLDTYFGLTLTAEEAGVKKPDPQIFHDAMKRVGASALESVMIGDSFEADILGAQKVGMKTIYFDIHKPTDLEAYRVKTLAEIKKFFS